MKRLLFILLLLISLNVCGQQNGVLYSQIVKSPDLYNPAYSTYSNSLSAKLLYSSKFLGYNKNPSSYALSVSMPIFGTVLGGGINVFREDVGINTISSINVNLKSSISISSTSQLTGGIQLGVRMVDKDINSLRTYNSEDFEYIANNVLSDENKMHLGVGLYYSNLFSFIGASISNIEFSDSNLFDDFDIYGGVYLNINDHIIFQPSYLVKRIFGYTMNNMRADFYYNDIFNVGLSYTVDRDLGANLGVKILKKIWINYSFERQFDIVGLEVYSNCVGVYYNTSKINDLAKLLRRSKRLRSNYL